MDSNDLDESMVNLIERTEAYLAAHSTIIGQNTDYHQESSSSINDAELYITADESSSLRVVPTIDPISVGSANSNVNDTNSLGSCSHLPLQSTHSNIIGLPSPNEVQTLSDSDDSSSTVSYEVNIPSAVPYAQVHPATTDQDIDDCVMVMSDVPTIDLCSPAVYDETISTLRRRRSQRRRVVASAPVIDSITLDDTVADVTTDDISSVAPNPARQSTSYVENQSTNSVKRPHLTNTEETFSTNLDPSPRNIVCPICIESIFKRKAASTICGHLFCYTCITQEFTIRKQCPICKQKLTRRLIHPIFFN